VEPFSDVNETSTYLEVLNKYFVLIPNLFVQTAWGEVSPVPLLLMHNKVHGSVSANLTSSTRQANNMSRPPGLTGIPQDRGMQEGAQKAMTENGCSVL